MALRKAFLRSPYLTRAILPISQLPYNPCALCMLVEGLASHFPLEIALFGTYLFPMCTPALEPLPQGRLRFVFLFLKQSKKCYVGTLGQKSKSPSGYYLRNPTESDKLVVLDSGLPLFSSHICICALILSKLFFHVYIHIIS